MLRLNGFVVYNWLNVTIATSLAKMGVDYGLNSPKPTLEP
jgi:hypothetical protein